MKHLSLLFGLLLAGCSYLPESAFLGGANFVTAETDDYILLTPPDSTRDVGLLFVPGGLVDAHAYLPALQRFTTDHHIRVVVVKVRSNLAITNAGQVKKVREQLVLPSWIIGGHSLGGVVASMAVDSDPDLYDGLFFLGSYALPDLSAWDEPVLNIFAENDGLTALEDVENAAALLPPATWVDYAALVNFGDAHGHALHFILPGGNHAGFASYGDQSGDGEATITTDQQHALWTQIVHTTFKNSGYAW